MCRISKNSLIHIYENKITYLKKIGEILYENKEPDRIGCRCNVVNIDETVFTKERIIKAPTHLQLKTKIANMKW